MEDDHGSITGADSAYYSHQSHPSIVSSYSGNDQTDLYSQNRGKNSRFIFISKALFSDVENCRNFGLNSFSKSCWTGLEKKFYLFTENKEFLRKFKIFQFKTKSNQDEVIREEDKIEDLNTVETESEIVQDVFDIKMMLEKLKAALVNVTIEQQYSAIAEENEFLKKEIRIMNNMIKEKDKKIQKLETLLSYEHKLCLNSVKMNVNFN